MSIKNLQYNDNGRLKVKEWKIYIMQTITKIKQEWLY